MASVCGGTLALLDAGVPLTRPVAGISVGICTEYGADKKISNYKLLTDIIGWEDAYCDMDCKIAGTEKGITGFQLDLKLKGIPFALMTETVEKARVARLHILAEMAKTLPAARTELSKYARASKSSASIPKRSARSSAGRQEHQAPRRGIRLRNQHRRRRHREHLLRVA